MSESKSLLELESEQQPRVCLEFHSQWAQKKYWIVLDTGENWDSQANPIVHGFLLSICSLSSPSSFAYCLPQLLLPFWPWILVVTCFLVTRVCSSLLSVLGFCVCFAIILVNQKSTPFVFKHCLSVPHFETTAMKPPSHVSVGRLGWAVLLFLFS